MLIWELILIFSSIIILILSLLNLFFIFYYENKIYDILKNRYWTKYNELGKPSIWYRPYRVVKKLLMLRTELPEDIELGRYVKKYNSAWILLRILLISLFIFGVYLIYF